jgi:indole-3-glycerol phosphate synthase
MTNKLAQIILKKQQTLAALKTKLLQQPTHPIMQLLRGEIAPRQTKDFKQALRGTSLAVISEIKRSSPSNGVLAEIEDPVVLTKKYLAGGANAISVLTEEDFFNGRLADLEAVTQATRELAVPILRKDFIVDPVQVAEAMLAGADAVLVIVAALGEETKTIIDCAHRLGIAAFVEVNNAAELEIALAGGAEIIGVNNRNLKTFTVDTDLSFRLVSDIPRAVVKVSASGVLDPALAVQYRQAGFDAVLIGEALVKSADPSAFIRACKGN